MRLFLSILFVLYSCCAASAQQKVYPLSSQQQVPFQEEAKDLIKRFYEELLECDNDPAFRSAFISNNIEPDAKFKPDYYPGRNTLQYLSFEQYLQGFIGTYKKHFSNGNPVFKQSAYAFSHFYLTADGLSSYVIVDFDNEMTVSGNVILRNRVSFYCLFPTYNYSSRLLVRQVEPKEKEEQMVRPVAGDIVVEAEAVNEKQITIHVNGVSFDMVYVEGGDFIMGSEKGDKDEAPLHRVTLSSFYMGQTEVTQALWRAVMENNPSYFNGDDLPVETVSWIDCQVFIKKLNSLSGKSFRLPTEAEWEYAACGGNKIDEFFYSGSDSPEEVSWSERYSEGKTHFVGVKKLNSLGLYDMSGNVWEWCSDWYDSYNSSKQTNPTGPVSGSNRVCRGGSWYNFDNGCTVSYRGSNAPDNKDSHLGFRLAFVSSSK